VNCSSYSDSSLNSGHLTSASSVDTYETLRVLNGETYMNCNEDHVQLGGTCNTADAKYNCLEMRIYKERIGVLWGTAPNQTDNLGCNQGHYRIACENGRFHAILPKPYDTALMTTETNTLEYQVQFQLYSSDDGTQYRAGEKSPMFNVYIQKNGACN